MKLKQALHDVTQENVELIAQLENDARAQRTLGERLTDRAAAFIGSWPFLVLQTSVVGIWVVVNLVGRDQALDPYPFVLLTLLLSVEAAFAMPIILMSENRQTRFIERRNHLDLQINLLAERENTEQLRLLRLVCEKIGVKLNVRESAVLAQMTEPEQIVRQITEATEKHRDA